MIIVKKVTLTALGILTIALAIPTLTNLAPSTFLKGLTTFLRPSRTMATQAVHRRTPVYFVSHGGPPTMFDKDHPVYPRLQAMGQEITQKIKPKAIVVLSAHWQAQRPNTIEVNVSEQEPLLYDFYGFPKHYYQEKFPNKGSVEIAERVIEVLGESGIQTEKEERGLDHGVFVPFKVMFHPDENPVDVPIVQVSLWDDDRDAEKHIKLGRALEKLRDENILLVMSGMAVHNLRHYMMSQMDPTVTALPYAKTFDEALKEAVETPPGAARDENMINLLRRPDGRQAHPTFEHLVPIHVGVGAAGNDSGQQLWTMAEKSFSWAQFRFGEVEA